MKLPSHVVAAGVTTMVLLFAYLATAAPDLTFWDASELAAAAHTLGIPHPPGTPLWVVMGRIAVLAFQSLNPARAVTMLSVLAGALTGGAGAWLATRWIGARGAVVSAVIASTFYTVWNNATETEVYAVSLLASVLLLVVAERAGRGDVDESQRARLRGVMAFMVGIAVPLHLSVLVAMPAALAFAWRGPRPRTRDVFGWVLLVMLGFSAVAVLPLLAARAPALNSGDPVTLEALIAVLRREQYQVPGLWPRQAPLWLQLGNVLQWADWQVALGLEPRPVPSWPRTSLTLLFVWIGLLGVRALWRHEARVGRAMALLALSASFGVAVWLNMRLGPTFGGPLVAPDTVHEARDRDYFFALGFWAWGMLAGAGLTAVSTTLARRLPAPVALLPFLAAVIPLVANRHLIDRTREPVSALPRVYARLLLDAVPERGVLLAGGDNDTFPLWYLQQVEAVREDVTVVTVPLLGAQWYRAQLVREGLLPEQAVEHWPGLRGALRSVMIHAERSRRPVRVSTLLDRRERVEVDGTVGWALEGLVYAPSRVLAPRTVGLDLQAMRESRDRTPPSALGQLPPGVDPALRTAQELLRCNTIERLSDPLLVSWCGGF
ncbi:MAG TPA: DUF2723 domain-containing protein [Gemmatimonas sp.]|uniref:protein O-mannosyl-transferase family n=1 Tax=Gemmatimonas sp. TaxID=1962908 RepID=UPI002EDA32F0